MPGIMQTDYEERGRHRPPPGAMPNGYGSYDYRRDGREDYFGPPDELYSKPNRNGNGYSHNDRFNWTDPVTDRTSLDGRPDAYKGSEPAYEVDHLATFTATKRGMQGLISLEEGLSKLRNMEVMTGIWTMRCLLVIERRHIIILDNQTGDEHDRFPIQLVHKPTAIVRNDPREIYNNLILFTVVTDPRKGDPEPNMHIFQSVSASVRDNLSLKMEAQEIADEIQASKDGKARLSQGHARIPPPPTGPAPDPPHMQQTGRSLVSHGITSRASVNEEIIMGRSSTQDAIGRYQPQDGAGRSSLYEEHNRPPMYGRVVPLSSNASATGSRVTETTNVTQSNNAPPIRSSDSAFYAIQPDPRQVPGMFPRNRPQVRHDQEDNDSMQGERIELDMSLRRHSAGSHFGLSTGSRGMENNGYVKEDYGLRDFTYDLEQKLNACCDDIEKFVARLQQAAEAFKELEKRKKDRGKQKAKQVGDGMLNMRARPPNNDDFIDIFQKFKYAFNILARLKPYIHDPNAPELVHFLFTPLSLIYEASRDSRNATSTLASRAVSPLLTREAKDLLLNCLTSKEQEFWMSLGDAWFMTKEQWRGSVPSYIPRFYNGWQPAPSEIDEDPRGAMMNQAVAAQMAQIRNRNDMESARERAAQQVLSYPPVEERFPRPYTDRRDDPVNPYTSRVPTPPPGALGGDPRVASYQEYVERHIDRNKRIHDDRVMPSSSPRAMSREEANQIYARDLLTKGGARIYEVVHRRQGKNPKELTVEEGDVLEVLEDSRNWWKLRNYQGEVGHAPYTILKEFKFDDNGYDDRVSVIPMCASLKRKIKTHKVSMMPDQDYERDKPRSNSGQYSSQLPSYQPASNQQATASSSLYKNSRQGQRDSYEEERRNFQESPRLTPPPSAPVPQAPPPPLIIERIYDTPPSKTRQLPNVAPKRDKKDELHDELRARMSNVMVQNKPKQYHRDVRISQHSTPDEVQDWLMGKQFSSRTLSALRDYTGVLMFRLKRAEMERLLGRDEGTRLDSLLTVQKNISGYGTKGASELQAILQRRRDQADSVSAEDDPQERLGKPPSFSPPDLSANNSEADSDEFSGSVQANTLRDMLRRQRQKIMTSQFEEPAFRY